MESMPRRIDNFDWYPWKIQMFWNPQALNPTPYIVKRDLWLFLWNRKQLFPKLELEALEKVLFLREKNKQKVHVPVLKNVKHFV